MAVINLFEDIENNKITRINAETGLSIKDSLKEMDWENCIILANGNNVSENYIIKPDDVISVKQYPSAITATVLAIDHAVGGPISTSIKDKVKNEIKKECSDMMGDLKAPSQSASNTKQIGQAEQLPTIRGASNQSANGHPVPLCIGKTLFSPYVCGAGYSEISGTDGEYQDFIFMLQLGYSDITVKNIRMGFLNVASNPTGEIPSNHFLTIDGNFRFRDGGENATQIELLGSGEDSTLYPVRVKQQNYSEHIIHTPASDGVREYTLKLDKFTELCPKKIEVEIGFDKLYKADEQNNLVDTSVEIGIAISYDDGHSWSPFNQITGSNSYTTRDVVLDSIDQQAGITGRMGVSTITRHKNKNLRFVATQEMAYSDIMNATNRVAIIRVVRINAESLSGSYQDLAMLSAIRTYTFDYKASKKAGRLISEKPVIDRIKDKTTRMAFKVRATSFIRGNLDKVDCIVEPKCRVWNGSSWSTGKQESSNPASVILNTVEHNMLGGNAYTDNDFLMEQWGVFYQFCEDHGIKVSGILTGQKKLIDIINTILANSRSALVMVGNKYSVWIDKPQDYPVTILNNHNILKDGLSNQKSFDVLPDAYLVKFIDEANEYQEGEFYVVVNEGADLTDPETVIESISLQYITNYNQAYKFILYYHATRKLRPETWIRKQGIEGNLVEIGDLVEFQDDTVSVGIGDGGEITGVEVLNGYVRSITTDAYFDVADLSLTYAVKLNTAKGVRTDKVVFEKVSFTNKFVFETPVSLDDMIQYSVGDVISFGLFEKVTASALVMGKKENTDQTFDLTLVPYQEGIYKADEGDIPAYDPKTTGSQMVTATPAIPKHYVDGNELNESLKNITQGTPISVPDDPTGVVAKAGEEGVTVTCNPPPQGLQNSIIKYVWNISKVEGEWLQIITSGPTLEYKFNRNTDGYPEAVDLEGWKARVKYINIYNKESNFSDIVPVSVDEYGTWIVENPVIDTRVNDRTITLLINQPERADNKRVYGTIRNAIRIRKPSVDMEENKWFTPATTKDPYPEFDQDGVLIRDNEMNYKENGNTPIYRSNIYTQTMPLTGQGSRNIIDTNFLFEIKAENEASSSEAVVTSVTALSTNLRDIVQANEDQKELYVQELSSLSANLGVIKQGSLNGSDNNYWALSTTRLASGRKLHEGAMRVGGDNQFFQVTPVVNDIGQIVDYEINFKVGNFEITSTSSNINGELIIQKDSKALDRTRITPRGTFFEHRANSSVQTWNVIASNTTNGVNTQQVYSDKTLVLSNQSLDDRRTGNTDIGNPYLTEASKVYHFDTGLQDQTNVSDLTIDGEYTLRGAEDTGTIDFTPAILAVSPYSTIGRSIYGQFSVVKNIGRITTYTVDFWIQYIFAENQIIFDIGTISDKIQLGIKDAEPYFNDINLPDSTEDDNFFLTVEQGQTQLFTKIEADLCPFTTKGEDENAPLITKEAIEPNLVRTTQRPWKSNYRYFIKENGVYREQAVAVLDYDSMVANGLYDMDSVFNVPEDAFGYLSHVGQAQKEEKTLEELGITFKENEWLHVAIISDSRKVCVYLNETQVCFDKFATVEDVTIVTLNEGKQSFLLDELFIDNTIAEDFETFVQHTRNRIPWGALSKDNDYFILMAKDKTKVVTNLFDTDVYKENVTGILQSEDFKNKVLEIVNSQS